MFIFNSQLRNRIEELEERLRKVHDRAHQRQRELDDKLSWAQRELTKAKNEINDWRLHYGSPVAPAVPPIRVERMVSVKFKALFDGLYQPTHFKAGPGPCGKTVKWFTITDTDREMTIHQHHEDGTRKDFIYRKSDVDGRIQCDYEMVELKGEDAERERFIRKMSVRARFA